MKNIDICTFRMCQASCILVLLAILICRIGVSGEDSSSIQVDLKMQIKSSDAIVIGYLTRTSPKYLRISAPIYSIDVREVIAGEIAAESYLVFPHVLSRLGPAVNIENGVLYILFIREEDLLNELAHDKIKAYRLRNNWMGVLSLSPDAKEKRFHKFLKKVHDIGTDSLSLVVKAIKAYVRDSRKENLSDENSELDSEEVQKMRQKLDLIE